MSTIDLSNIAEGQIVSTTFSVSRNASFDNTVDFYEIDSDGGVVDPVSGNVIAPGEEGYREAALANRVGLALRTENGITSEFVAELESGKQYAPLIAIESAIEPLRGTPVIYFTYSEANTDGFDHVRNSSDNFFEFEDFVNGGDADFNDLVIDVSFDEAILGPPVVVEEPAIEEPVVEEPAIEEPAIEEPVVEEPAIEEPVVEEPAIEEPVVEEPAIEEPVVEEPAIEEPVVEEPAIEEPVVEEPVVEEPVVEEPAIEEPVVEEPVVEEPAIEEPVVEEPVVEEPAIEEPVVEEPTQPTVQGVVFDVVPGDAFIVQNLDSTVENGEFSFDPEGTQPGFFSIADVDLDFGAGIASIAFDFDEQSTTGNDTIGFDDLSFYRFVIQPEPGVPAIESVTIRDLDNSLGLESRNISFTDSLININTNVLDLSAGGEAVLDIEFANL